MLGKVSFPWLHYSVVFNRQSQFLLLLLLLDRTFFSYCTQILILPTLDYESKVSVFASKYQHESDAAFCGFGQKQKCIFHVKACDTGAYCS